MKYKAFSLIELLVVVAIIAVLSAIALPVYQNYKNRTLVAAAYNAMQGLQDLAYSYYVKNGTWPPSLNYGGTTLNQSSWTPTPSLNAVGVYGMSFNPNIGNLIVYTVVTGLKGVQNYQDGTVGGCFPSAAGCYNSIALMTKDINGALETKCGLDTPSSTYYLPIQVQPTTCTCTNLNSWWASGTGC